MSTSARWRATSSARRAAGQVGEADHAAVPDTGRAVVGPAVREQGGQLGLLDVAAGGEAAAGDGPQIHGPQVVVGGPSGRAATPP